MILMIASSLPLLALIVLAEIYSADFDSMQTLKSVVDNTQTPQTQRPSHLASCNLPAAIGGGK